MGYTFAFMLIFMAVFMVITRCCSQGSVDELTVIAPPALTTVEQLLAVQNAISQAEELIQDGNIVLLKTRALLLSIFPQVCWLLFVLFILFIIYLFYYYYSFCSLRDKNLIMNFCPF